MSIRLGSNAVKSIRLGSTPIEDIGVGSNGVWNTGAAQPGPTQYQRMALCGIYITGTDSYPGLIPGISPIYVDDR